MKTDTIDRVNGGDRGDDQRKGEKKMTSNEALEKLLHSHICYDCTAEKECCKTCHSRLCYEAVKKDLEVLEILKKHLLCLSNCEDEEPNEHIEACSGEGTDSWGYNKFSNWNINCVSDFRIVKEWLEK